MLKKVFFIFLISFIASFSIYSQQYACKCPDGHVLEDKKCKPTGDYLECVSSPSNGVWKISYCTCPQTGRVLSGKVCIDIPGYKACVNGLIKGKWINNTCVCDIPGTRLNKITGSCEKIPGYEDCVNGEIKGKWINNTCVCDIPGTRLNTITGKCEKIPGYLECVNPPSSGKWENNVCICPFGKRYDGLRCVPLICDLEKEYIDGNVCTKIIGYDKCILSGGKCVKSADGKSCICGLCPHGKKIVNNECKTFSCSIGQFINGNICSPIVGWTECRNSGGTCASTTISPCVCGLCPDGKKIVNNICVLKPGYSSCLSSGGKWNHAKDICTCPTGKYHNNSTKRCVAIPKYNECVNPPSNGTWTLTVASSSATTGSASSSGSTSGSTSGSSNVPSIGSSFAPTVSLPSSTTSIQNYGYCRCNGGKLLNKNTGVCYCEYGEKSNGICKTLLESKKEWCEKTMLQTWDSSAQKCKFRIIRIGRNKCSNDYNWCTGGCFAKAENVRDEGQELWCDNNQDIKVNASTCQNDGKGCYVQRTDGKRSGKVYHKGKITPPIYPETKYRIIDDKSVWEYFWSSTEFF